LIEAVVVILAIMGIFLFFTSIPSISESYQHSGQLACGANLKGIYQAMYAYGISQRNKFPTYLPNGDDAKVFGFADIARSTASSQADPPAPALLNGNITAALWLLIRDESTDVKSWLCFSDSSCEADQLCQFTGDLRPREFLIENPVLKRNIWDFAKAENLSYSPINFYHIRNRQNWALNVPVDMVIMGDDNDNEDLHRHIVGEHGAGDRARLNSSNHRYLGQNFLFGDGHVSFLESPYQGPKKENVYATIVDGQQGPPRLGNSDGDAPTSDRSDQTTLIPITGNGGVSLSGLPGGMDVVPGIPERYPYGSFGLRCSVAALIIALLAYLLHRDRKRRMEAQAGK
jgi:prepilin-type processing-associated H-X9-DG protein